MLFTAGLSVMFCLSVVRDFDLETVITGTQSVAICESALKQMVEELPDAKRYVAVFEALRAYVVRKYTTAINFHPHTEPLFRTTESILHDQYAELANGSLLDSQTSISGWGPTSSFHAIRQNHDSQVLLNELDVTPIPNNNTQMHTDTAVSEGSILSFDIFGDDALWNMEAGLSEYACGDPPANLYGENPFELQYTL
jgi:hypothetical protein